MLLGIQDDVVHSSLGISLVSRLILRVNRNVVGRLAWSMLARGKEMFGQSQTAVKDTRSAHIHVTCV